MLLQIDIWPILLENGLPMAIMGAIIYWLVGEYRIKEKRIAELHEALRTDQKENLTLLLKFEKVLDKIIDSTVSSENNIVSAVQSSSAELKQHVSTKIELLKEVLKK